MADKRDEGFLESIKDFLGIMDDANDFLDKLRDKQRRITAMMKKFSSMTEEQTGIALGMLHAREDPKKVKAIMDKLDIRRPLLFGKTIMRELQDHNRDLGKLESKLNKMPSDVRSEVKPMIVAVRRQLTSGMRDHLRVIQVFSTMQDRNKKFWRTVAAAGAAVVLTAGALAIGVSIAEQVRQFKGVREFTDWLGTGLNELAANMQGLHRRAGQVGGR